MRRTGLLLSIAIVVSLSHHVMGRATAARAEDTTDTKISDGDATVLVQRFEQWATAELRKMDPVGELYLQPDRGDKASDSYSWGRVVTSSGDLPAGVEELLSPDPRFDAHHYVLRFLRHDVVNGTPVSVYETHPRGKYDGFEGQVALDREGVVWQVRGQPACGGFAADALERPMEETAIRVLGLARASARRLGLHHRRVHPADTF